MSKKSLGIERPNTRSEHWINNVNFTIEYHKIHRRLDRIAEYTKEAIDDMNELDRIQKLQVRRGARDQSMPLVFRHSGQNFLNTQVRIIFIKTFMFRNIQTDG